jgi:hypothetical protein
VFSATSRHRYATNEAIDVVETRTVKFVKHLTNVLVCNGPASRKRSSVRESIATITVMCNLGIFDKGPYLLFQKMEIGHVFVSGRPRFDPLLEIWQGSLNTTPHATIHNDTVIDVITQYMDRILRLDPFLHCEPRRRDKVRRDRLAQT